MPPRRPIDDEEDPQPRRKGTRKKAAKKSVLPLVLLAGGGAAFLLVVGVVLYFALRKSHSDPNPPGGPAAKGAPSGPAKWAGGGTAPRPAPVFGPAPVPAPTPGPAPAAGTELVTNGGFEDGPEPDPNGPGFTVVPAGAPTIPGWTVTRGSVDYIGPYWQHADGKRSIDLNGNEPGTIAQAIRTKAGAKYR